MGAIITLGQVDLSGITTVAAQIITDAEARALVQDATHLHVDDIWEAAHHNQKVYPTLADAVTVSSDAVAWTLGNFAEIIPANAIETEFHIHHIAVVAPSANGEYELVIYNGTTEIGRASFSRSDKKDDVERLVFITDHTPANTQIQAKLEYSEGGGVETTKVKIWYHDH